MAVLAAILLFALPSLGQQPAAPAAEPGLDRALLRELLGRVSDADLRAAIEATVGDPAPAGSPVTDAQPAAAEAGGLWDDAVGAFADLREQWPFLLFGAELSLAGLDATIERISGGRGVLYLLRLLAELAVFAAVGLAVEWLFRRAVRRFAAGAAAPSLGDKLHHALRQGLIELAAIGLFLLVSWGLFVLLHGGEAVVRPLLASIVAGLAMVRLAISASRLVLQPGRPALRLPAMADAEARALHGWVVALAAIATLGWLATALVLDLGLGYELWFLVVAAAGAVVVLALLVAIWRWRKHVRRALDGAGWLRRGFAASWHALASLYVLAVWAVWTTSLLTVGSRRLDAAVASVIILLAVPVVRRLARPLLRRLLEPRGATPGELRPRSYVAVADRAFGVLVWIAAALFVLQLWGADLEEMAARGQEPVARAVLSLAVTLLIAAFGWQLVEATLDRLLRRAAVDPSLLRNARARTLVPLLRKVLLAIVVIVVGMIALSTLGVDIAPLLASAGVVGIAVGFGAQALVRDIFSGIFFLVDDAFRVGEYVEAGELRGTVEAISLRSFRLRHHRGAIHTVPFGELRSLTNYSRDWVIEKLELGVTYDTDITKVKAVLKQVGRDLAADPELAPNLIETLKSQGVSRMADFAIIIRAKFKARPGEQFIIRREAYRRIKEAFDANGIKFAFPTVTIDRPAAGAPTEAELIAAAKPASIGTAA